jgi:hypothetical protein
LHFGSGGQKALKCCFEGSAYWHTGRGAKPCFVDNSLPLKTLCDLCLDRQESLSVPGSEFNALEVKPETLWLPDRLEDSGLYRKCFSHAFHGRVLFLISFIENSFFAIAASSKT